MEPCRWLVPALMGISILSATLLALAHHLFYTYLDGGIVGSNQQQQWFLRIGTALAFVIKSLMTASVTLAYVQLLWRTLKSATVSINGLDSLFGVIHNPWNFIDWELWMKGPTLVVIALIIWTLPVIALVTPATLTIQPASRLNETTVYSLLPSIEYDSSVSRRWAEVDEILDSIGSSFPIIRLVSSVASRGSILPISAPYPNCTYSIEFFGPSVSCGNPTVGNASFSDGVRDIINHFNGGGSTINYIMFVPCCVNQTADAALHALNQTLLAADAQSTVNMYDLPLPTLDVVSPDRARFFITLPTKAFGMANEIIECGLYNTSYTANFTFNNGQQDITVTNVTRINGITGDIVVNSFTSEPSLCTQTFPCYGTGLASISIMQALGTLLIGLLTSSTEPKVIDYDQTQITTTILMETEELQEVTNSAGGGMEQVSIANVKMAQALEDLVTNITISLFSDSYFLQNSSTASILPILVRTPQNAYVYSPAHLLAAYGASIFVTGTVVLVGLFCIWSSSEAFAASFSSILRTTRNPQLDAIVQAKETQATVPISKRLGKVKLFLGRRFHGGELWTAFAIVQNSEDGKGARTQVVSKPQYRKDLDPARDKPRMYSPKFNPSNTGSEFRGSYDSYELAPVQNIDAASISKQSSIQSKSCVDRIYEIRDDESWPLAT